MALSVRPLGAEDFPEWSRLWRGYLEFYRTELSDEMIALAFERMLSGAPGEFRGLLAIEDGRPVGLAHYLLHRHGWRPEPVCYLQDLFVDPERRGTGLGRALIEAVYAAADEAGAPQVWWLTAEDNVTGRRLYNRIGKLTPFVKYSR